MNIKTLRTILLTLFFIAFVTLFFYLTIKDKFNFADRVKINGVEKITKEEILLAIKDLQLVNKNFWQINPRKVSQYISKRPLIKDVKIRTHIIPKAHYVIYILEESIWAKYRDSILNQNAEIVVDSPAVAKLYQSEAVTKLYQNPNLVKISSYSLLEQGQLQQIKEASLFLSRHISLINNLDSIVSINLDSDSNISLKSKNYEIFLGALDEKLLERTKKIEQISYTAKKLKDQLEYIDLSLSTDEVILGKKT